MSHASSADERLILQQIHEQQQRININFQQIQLKSSEIISDSPNNPQQQPQQSQSQSQSSSYFDKYKDCSVQTIRSKYEGAVPGFKWLQLPYCKNMVYFNMLFCLPFGALGTWSYWLWYRTRYKVDKAPRMFFVKRYPTITFCMCGLSFVHSLMFEPHCDINSYHYSGQFQDRELARMIKKQYKTK